jgi:hypothetical protein
VDSTIPAARAVLLRAISALLLAAAALAALVLIASLFSGRTVLAVGSLRVTAHDPYRPMAIVLGCLGLFGLLRACGTARRWRLSVSWVLLGAAAVMALGISLRDAPRGVALADAAIGELYVLHALEGAWLLGPYSQYFWHHPGPAMFYALAPLYALAERHPAALGVGALLLNVAAVAGSIGLATRQLSVAAAVPVCLVCALWIWRTAALLTSYWNPHLILLSTLLFFWLATSVSGGRVKQLPLLAAAGSFLAQTHLGTAPLVAGLAVLAAGLAWKHRTAPLDDAARSARRRALNAAAWVLALFWALPVAEQLANPSGGNIGLLLQYFREQRASAHDAVDIVNAWAFASTGALVPQFRHPIGWTIPGEPHPLVIAATLCQLAGLVLVAYRARASDSLSRAALLAAAAEIIALVSMLRVPGEIHDHSVFWIGVIGASGWGVLFGALASPFLPVLWTGPVPRRRFELLAAVGITTLTLGLGGSSMADALKPHVQSGAAAEVLELHAGLQDALDRRHVARPLVRIQEEVWAQAAGTLLLFYKNERAFAVERRWVHMYGAPLAARGCDFSHVLRFAPAGAPGTGERLARAGGVEARLEATTCRAVEP